jgi:hypothetical protein
MQPDSTPENAVEPEASEALKATKASQSTGPIFLRQLLNKYFTGTPDALAQIMPKEEYDILQGVRLTLNDPEKMLFRPQEWLSSMDPSWLTPTLQKLSKPLQEVYAKAFPTAFGKLAPEAKAAPYNETVQDFLISYLHSAWAGDAAPPKEMLLDWELTFLLKLSRKEILQIVDLLCMYDLVEEMRHIVDKKQLLAVQQYLTQDQQQYLRILLRQKSRIKPSLLSVQELLKEGPKFPQILHKFGLQRLAFALSGAKDDFIWHIEHTLDLARAKFLLNHIKEEEIPNQTPQALLQVQHIFQFLKTEKTAP